MMAIDFYICVCLSSHKYDILEVYITLMDVMICAHAYLCLHIHNTPSNFDRVYVCTDFIAAIDTQAELMTQ